MAQVVEAEEIKGVLHPTSHGFGWHADVLHRVGQLVLHRLGHERGQWVLPHEADDVGEVPRTVVLRRAPFHRDRAGQRPAAEVGHEPVDGPEQRSFPGTRFPDDHPEFALGDVQVDPIQCWP